uniref:TMEM135_C_rich domain-containing protein n=1 Tax=Glossina austeni TaxID=7395 RepID=A0A1A9UJW8_GLOAU
MGGFSKFFNEHLTTLTCREIHKGISCKKQALNTFIGSPIKSLKSLAPIAILSLLPKIRTLSQTDLQETVRNYVIASLAFALNGATAVCLVCLLGNLLGKLTLYTTGFVPCLLSSYCVLFSDTNAGKAAANAFYQCFIESLLRRKNVISRTVSGSKLIQTIIFMVCSGLILHGKREYNVKEVWIATPNRLAAHNNDAEKSKIRCHLHNDMSCRNYLWIGMRNYFLTGLVLDCVSIFKAIATQPTSGGRWSKLKHFQLFSAPLACLYIALYRSIHCFLNHFNNSSDQINHALASCCAGLCYFLYPQQSLFCFAVLQAVQTLWQLFKIANSKTTNKCFKFFLNFSYRFIMYPLIQAYMAHIYVMKPQLCSQFTVQILDNATNDQATAVMNYIQKSLHRAKNYPS